MKSVSRYLSLGLLAAVVLVSASAFAAPKDDTEWIADKRGCKVANPFPRAGETITWSGPCKNGFADGQGVLQWYLNGKADDRYEGNLQMGWAEGKGILSKPDGEKYDGDWKDSLQEGSGRYDAPDGSWYEGGWKGGKPNGQGQFHRPDGKVFIGEWIDGVYEGDIEPDADDADPNKT
jgi:hypothetical protein